MGIVSNIITVDSSIADCKICRGDDLGVPSAGRNTLAALVEFAPPNNTAGQISLGRVLGCFLYYVPSHHLCMVSVGVAAT